MKKLISFIWLTIYCAGILSAQEAPIGVPVKPDRKDKKKLEEFQDRINGKIVWSTSRSSSKHDIWIMNADGTEKKQLTDSPNNVDWFSRFSPDGKTVLFVRSKNGWVSEKDAKYFRKWDLWTISLEDQKEKKIVENACWGTWRPDGKDIVFARGSKVFTMNIETKEETMILDGNKAFKEGTIVQQPQMSPNGKYLAATLRGTSRETGIYDLENETWTTTGKGCQVNWLPSGDKVVRMNPTGHGGTAAPSEVLLIPVENGKPTVNVRKIRKMRMMDLPERRRSHEYFPQFDSSGKWMVWCATSEGHDHDLYDYEVYIWEKGTGQDEAVRLTFHTANDRWPDIMLEAN
jgi:dipeptidyl aminopeptidase/acylaminoacyl peptidase